MGTDFASSSLTIRKQWITTAGEPRRTASASQYLMNSASALTSFSAIKCLPWGDVKPRFAQLALRFVSIKPTHRQADYFCSAPTSSDGQPLAVTGRYIIAMTAMEFY